MRRCRGAAVIAVYHRAEKSSGSIFAMIHHFPCIFTIGAVVLDKTLVMSYGAADQNIDIAKVSLAELVSYVRRFDAQGNRTDAS